MSPTLLYLWKVDVLATTELVVVLLCTHINYTLGKEKALYVPLNWGEITYNIEMIYEQRCCLCKIS